MSDEAKERELLTQRADDVRSRLDATLDELDHKRHHPFEMLPPIELPRAPFRVIAGSVATALVAGVGLAVYRIARRPQRLRSARVEALQRLWNHPERAFQAGRTSVWQELGRRLLVGGASFLATQLLRRALDLALPLPPEPHEPTAAPPT